MRHLLIYIRLSIFRLNFISRTFRTLLESVSRLYIYDDRYIFVYYYIRERTDIEKFQEIIEKPHRERW